MDRILAEGRGRKERPFPVVMYSEAGYTYIKRFEYGHTGRGEGKMVTDSKEV